MDSPCSSRRLLAVLQSCSPSRDQAKADMQPRDCTAAAAASMHKATQRFAYLGWGLQLHPKILYKAFWRTVTHESLLQSDRQFSSYVLLALAVVTVPHLSAGSLCPAAGLLLAWVLVMAWVWLLQQQAALYCRHRIAILSVLRLLLALVGAQTTRRMQMQLHGPAEVQQPLPVFAAGMQLLLLTNTVHIPMLAVRLPMPMLLQLLLTAAQPAMLLAGGVVRDLVASASTGEAQDMLAGVVAAWGSLIESGRFVAVRDSPLLQGRSSALLLAVCTMYATTVSITLYVCYISLWGLTLRWLRQQVGFLFESQVPDGRAPADVINIGGCVLERQRAQDICSSPAATLLLSPTGLKGRLARLCIHTSLVNLLCLVCLLGSQVLVQQVLPRLLSQQALNCWYPLVQGQ